MSRTLTEITVKLRLDKLDEAFTSIGDFKTRAKRITLTYDNIGEGCEWEDDVDFEVVSS